MKILQINAVYGHGSTGTIVRDIEQLCLVKGIDCYVASPDINVKNAKHGYVIGNTLDHKFHAFLSRINGKQGYFSWFATKKLLLYIDRIKPNIVHLHNLHSNYIHLNLLLQHLAKKDIKTIITLHDCWFYTGGCFHYTSAKCNKWLTGCGNCPKKKQDTPAWILDKSAKILSDRKKYLLAIPHLIITGVSEWMVNEAKRTFLQNTPSYVIHNGIDLQIFRPTSSELKLRMNLQGKRVYLGPASKWLSRINHDTFQYFTNKMSADEVLILFGAQNAGQSVPSNVVLYGYTKDTKELAALYSMADVFVNPTREESLSLINIESQACGTPVVTYGGTGVQETVDEKCGFSVKSGDYLSLYATAKSVAKKNMQQGCLQWVGVQYDQNCNYKQYIQLYTTNYI